MSDAPHDLEGLQALSDLVEKSFPDLRCLRCGNKDFYLYPQEERRYEPPFRPLREGGLHIVPLICTRCGMVEQHMAEMLTNAVKPIKYETEGNS